MCSGRRVLTSDPKDDGAIAGLLDKLMAGKIAQQHPERVRVHVSERPVLAECAPRLTRAYAPILCDHGQNLLDERREMESTRDRRLVPAFK